MIKSLWLTFFDTRIWSTYLCSYKESTVITAIQDLKISPNLQNQNWLQCQYSLSRETGTDTRPKTCDFVMNKENKRKKRVLTWQNPSESIGNRSLYFFRGIVWHLMVILAAAAWPWRPPVQTVEIRAKMDCHPTCDFRAQLPITTPTKCSHKPPNCFREWRPQLATWQS